MSTAAELHGDGPAAGKPCACNFTCENNIDVCVDSHLMRTFDSWKIMADRFGDGRAVPALECRGTTLHSRLTPVYSYGKGGQQAIRG